MILLHYSKKIGKSASGLPKIKIPGFATLKPFILDPKFSCSKREGKPTTSEKFKIWLCIWNCAAIFDGLKSKIGNFGSKEVFQGYLS